MFKLSVALLSATLFLGNFTLPVRAQTLPERGPKLAVAGVSAGDNFTWKKPLIPVTQDFTLAN